MNDNIIQFDVPWHGDLDPDAVLESAKGRLANVVIAGWDHNDELVFASSLESDAETNMLLDLAKQELISAKFTDNE